VGNSINVLKNNDGIVINITDNGIGFDSENISESAQGLGIVDGLAEQIDATYTINGQNGTDFKLNMETRMSLN